MGLTLNLKQSKVTICIVLQGLKEVIMNTFATAIMLTVGTLLFMPTTSQPTPSDQQQREEGEEERDEDKLWEAKDEMMREVLMEEGKKYADVMKRLATAIEGPEFWDSPIESFLKALMSTVHKGESEEKP